MHSIRERWTQPQNTLLLSNKDNALSQYEAARAIFNPVSPATGPNLLRVGILPKRTANGKKQKEK